MFIEDRTPSNMATIRAFIYFLFVVTLSLTFSCRSTPSRQSLNAQYKDIYLDQFKLTYFRKRLIKSYNNSNAIREIISTDHSGFTEPILTDRDYKLIDSLTTLDNQHLIADSIEGSRRAGGAQGKRPLRFIMDKLTSEWLDSLAQQRLEGSGVPNDWSK